MAAAINLPTIDDRVSGVANLSLGNQNWATQAQVSAYALTMGDSMEIIELDNYLQSLNYKELQEMTKTEQDASKALGTAMQQSGEYQAASTRKQAWGSIAMGAAQGAALIGSVAISAVGAKSTESINLGKQIENAETYQVKLNQAPPQELGLSQPRNVDSAQVEAAARTKLNALKFSEKMSNGPQEDDSLSDSAAIESVQQQAQDPVNGEEARETLKYNKQRVRDTIEDLREQKKVIDNKYQSYAEKLNSIGQIAGQATQGTFNLYSAKKQVMQALYECLRQQTQYAYDAIHQANGTTGQNAANLGQKVNTDIQTLLGGIAASNQIRG